MYNNQVNSVCTQAREDLQCSTPKYYKASLTDQVKTKSEGEGN